jgi:hypothetical protein
MDHSSSSSIREGNDGGEQRQRVRVHEYPTEPPYKAYIGNLAYCIRTERELSEALSTLVAEQLQVQMKFMHGHVVVERYNNNRPRGYGYIEVGTLEELQKLMELNKSDHAIIGGRLIQLDTALPRKNEGIGGGSDKDHRRRTTNYSNIDGTKFRGGRHAGHENKNTETPITTPTDPPQQRPVLKLKPRSKPIDSGITKDGSTDTNTNIGNSSSSSIGGGSGSYSNIFGSARARDEPTWQEQQQQKSEKQRPTTTETKIQNNSNSSIQSPPPQQPQPVGDLKSSSNSNSSSTVIRSRGRGSHSTFRESGGRGEKGSTSASGRSSGSGEHIRSKGKVPDVTATEKMKKVPSKFTTVDAVMTTKTTTTTKSIEPETKVVPAKPTNIFAALALDDSDSD